MDFRRRNLIVCVIAVIALVMSHSSADAVPKLAKLKTAKVVRVGFFTNVTHAPAMIAQERNLFQKHLKADGTIIEFVAFNAGPAAIEAMKGGAIDITYIGPSPSINGFASTKGSLLRVVSGSTSGGAEFVVNPSISTVEDLKGKKFATPQLGNTQDVAIRAWLKGKGLSTSVTGAGDVTIIPTENAQSLVLFQRGDIDGAWLPEPWSSRLVIEAGAKVFLNERTLWPKGQFVTTQIIASTDFLKKYPGTVRSVIRGHLDAIVLANKNPLQSQDDVQKQIEKWTGKRLPDAVMTRSWSNLTFTADPISNSLSKSADDAVQIGLLTTLGSRGLSGIYDLRLLNSLLTFKKAKKVSAQGLGLQ